MADEFDDLPKSEPKEIDEQRSMALRFLQIQREGDVAPSLPRSRWTSRSNGPRPMDTKVAVVTTIITRRMMA